MDANGRGPTAEDVIKAELARLKAEGVSKGELALQALMLYRAVGVKVPVPDWVLREIVNCYRGFKDGKPGGAFPRAVAKKEAAPLTLGQAFGVPDLRGSVKTALKRRRLALATPDVVALFTGQNGVALPRTKDGFAEAAQRISLTADQVEAILPKTRTNRRK